MNVFMKSPPMRCQHILTPAFQLPFSLVALKILSIGTGSTLQHRLVGYTTFGSCQKCKALAAAMRGLKRSAALITFGITSPRLLMSSAQPQAEPVGVKLVMLTAMTAMLSVLVIAQVTALPRR